MPPAEARGVVVLQRAQAQLPRPAARRRARHCASCTCTATRTLLAARLAARTGHYMPPSLLQSQLDTLEPPGADEPR
jgi:gluconokinase